MFLKKKFGPAVDTGNDTGAGPRRNDGLQTPSPVSPPTAGYTFDVPTLHPSPAAATQPQTLAARTSSQVPRHGRSVSHPFPSTGGGEGRRPEPGKPTDIKGSGGVTERGGKGKFSFFSSSAPKQSSKGQPNESDLISGKCATCDSTVRWPRHLDVFRCTVCMMVNDMQYGTIKETPGVQDGQSNGPRLPRKVLPVSVDRTKSLISQCTHAFLRRKVDELKHAKAGVVADPERSKETEKPESDRAAPRHNPFLNVAAANRSNNRSVSRGPVPGKDNSQVDAEKLSFDGDRPRTAPGQPRASEDIAPFQPRYIYRHFESYLLSCLNDCDCLNMSFAIARPPAPVRAASEMSSQHESHKKFDPLEGTEGYLGELDPKMLLMGDIGENARYWLGDGSDNTENHGKGHDPSRHSTKGNKSAAFERKPPRFNWKQVWDWYQSILLSGRNWRSIRSSFTDEERKHLHDSKIERDIDQALAEGRHHVQRTLLKATENLLRHPGRPLKRPEDSRFLLILLLNPLLHPQHSHHANTWSPEQAAQSVKFPDALPSDQAARKLERAKNAAEAASKGSATGHHSGIIKRLMGLIGNLPQDCHSSIISWLHRMPVPQLRDLVDLVSGFVSYRLTRNAGRARAPSHDPTNGLIPVLLGPSAGTSAQLHAAIGGESSTKPPKLEKKDKPKENAYADDWQVKAAARVMSLLFFANFGHSRGRQQLTDDATTGNAHSGRHRSVRPGQALPLSEYYNVLLDDADIVADFELWELRRNKFSFCQYPMFLSIWSKIRLMEYDARRQMHDKARNAFFDSIMTRKIVNQNLILHVRRECLLEDSLKEISKVVGAGEEEIKKGLKIEFDREEGIDIGGLRKEWFLLLVREVFDPRHGLFLYDEDSQYCYFNPHTFETSEQYYLVGVVLGLAIYNSTILDIDLPPFLFKKLLAAAPPWTGPSISAPRPQMTYTLDDLAEWRPSLAKGLRQLLEYEGDVESTFCRDFVADVDRYGTATQTPLVPGGEKRPVTNANRREFVNLYVRHVLDWSVARQFEPFKRGFFTVCSGNALALFRPEEIEMLVRGSDEALDVESLQAVAVYDNWDWAQHDADVSNVPDVGVKPTAIPTATANKVPQIRWFWEAFREADTKDQRRLLLFVTGSDRIPAMGTTSLVFKVANLGSDSRRFPIARTCFNTIGLYEYESKEQLEHKLWTAVGGSEGFGLK